MGFRHFWENPHYNIFSEARAAKETGGFFERNIIFFVTLIFSPPPFAMKKPSPLGRAASFSSSIRVQEAIF